MPTVYSIPPGVPFVDALAAQIAVQCENDPLALPKIRILLPTRRACRALALAFSRLQNQRPTLLPRMQPIGDMDEDELSLEYADVLGDDEFFDVPPAINPIRRQLLLTRLILALRGEITLPDQAARLARELARLIDQVHTERCTWENLDRLVPDEFAEHWQITLQFLKLASEFWPKILAEEGCIDPADRRNRLLKAQGDAWTIAPPLAPVIAAGSTGSIPATADLLRVVSMLPQGAVVLPGLDVEADAATWEAIMGEVSHPQYSMGRLLRHLGLAPTDVRQWPFPPNVAAVSPPSRAALLNQALRPAGCPIAVSRPKWIREAVTGLTRIDVPGPEEEARVIALLMRQSLEDPEQTTALVTPDRRLARRVAAELQRWNIALDDSAGIPLADTPCGTFARLVARMVAERFAPIALLSALKHPLVCAGLAPGRFRHQVLIMERTLLRGPRPSAGLAGLQQAARASGVSAVIEVVERLTRATAEFTALLEEDSCDLRHLVTAHVSTMEILATVDEADGVGGLWLSEDGKTLAAFFDILIEAAKDIIFARPTGYPAFLDTLLTGHVLRPSWGRHPRLAVWGPLEARLQHADVMILGGLNEGTWPPSSNPSPWMSRPMLKAFGLPLPERRTGLSAHDFCQAASAKVVWLTRARRVGGIPTVSSRWLIRLDTSLRCMTPDVSVHGGLQWLAWQSLLDRPSADRQRIDPPSPRPPVAARPRQLSVTRIGTWMRDPYAVYAEFILRLQPLDPIDADPTTADYGILVHRALEAFVCRYPGELPKDALEQLLECGRQVFTPLLERSDVRAFWWPRFERIAQWVVATERQREQDLISRHSEVNGKLIIDAPLGKFEITAKADRIDLLADGNISIIDYKTGYLPSKKEIMEGFAPQLPLEATIAMRDGFDGIPSLAVQSVEFWQLKGSQQGGDRRIIADDAVSVLSLAKEAFEGLTQLIATFDREETPYYSRPRASAYSHYSRFEHLARVKEWAATGVYE